MPLSLRRLLPLTTLTALGLLAGASLLLADATTDSEKRLLDDVRQLASDEWEGRGLGTQGINKAADFIRDQFAAAGLNVTVDDGDAFQEFDVVNGVELEGTNELALVGPDGKATPLKIKGDFEVGSFGDSGTLDTPLVFVGYGIDIEGAYNDYDGIDVKDKVVVLMRRTPQQDAKDGPFSGHGAAQYGALRTKVSNAFRRGAKGIILLNDPHTGRDDAARLQEQLEKARSRIAEAALAFDSTPADKNEEVRKTLAEAAKHYREVKEQVEKNDTDPLMAFGYGGAKPGDSVPIFHLKRSVLDPVLKATLKKTSEEIEAEIDKTGKPLSADLIGWKAVGQVHLKVLRAKIKNVVGVLEPAAGPLAKETIVVGAHYDHLGYGEEGSMLPGSKEIHNGADDNASGTAGLLELVRRLSAERERIPRRIVFIAFTGEERGLLGSAYYVKTPLVPLEDTIAMFNLDMIGRLDADKLTVYGTGTAPVWNALVDEANKSLKFEITKKPEGFGPSDHSSFYAKKIPVMHVFTGLHADYHRPADDWDKLNVPGMRRICDFYEQLILGIARADKRPEYIRIEGNSQLAREGSRPYFGSIPDFNSDAKGYAIQGVAPDSPAEKGGIKAGDVIIGVGKDKVGSLDDFDLALRKFKAGEEVDVTVRRGMEEVTLKVTLAKPRA
ncbi:M20/M25/M40 family metallo-hydrolase [Planctomyces sp. SH-PL14]|uniref:M20/M25/M40 family metallo-hydrolase n=1 Tax=Planctomyces sp. SH-PL14 TaxID=1632864 RepID=UPI00078E8B7B|nr:M20/M25/M40 family metallo-hydrolase [Planctomyces sp. SH-PL14]AMV21109.1 Aminopeptidase YwaD precursor [Planctomyces sp. SH-PL14]